MDGHSNGYPWDNQDRSFDYRQLEIDHNRDRVRKILREFGEERKLSDMPKYTTFIGVKGDFSTDVLAIVDINGVEILVHESRLNKLYWVANYFYYKSYIFITDNEKGLNESHWFRSIPIDKSAKVMIEIRETKYVDVYPKNEDLNEK